MEDKNWYALFVVTGEEDHVKERLQYRFGETLRAVVPKRKLRERRKGVWKDVIRALFPGYVLINGNIGLEEYYRLKDIPGLIKLLKNDQIPLKIDDYEMDVIKSLIFEDETIDYSDVLLENGKVVVVEGPLVSMEGRVVSVDKRKGRAKVLVGFMGEERIIELGVNILQRLEV